MTLPSNLAKRTREILGRANMCSLDLLEKAKTGTDAYLAEQGINNTNLCFAAVGSIGRREALSASDLDLCPIAHTKAALHDFAEKYDQPLRRHLAQHLGIKVSAGSDLTAPSSLEQMTKPDAIGGDLDDATVLTKRILILFESTQITGALHLTDVRSRILEAYAGSERTRGRHLLALCNDVARYYRTLCIEYKAKVDCQDKDWCTRNVKLRHSRKLWYFSGVLTLVALARDFSGDDDGFKQALLDELEHPPVERMLRALERLERRMPPKLLDAFAWFLDFMANPNHREVLADVQFENRYQASPNNPFPGLKRNSDVLHSEIVHLIEDLPYLDRRRVIDWFLL